MLSPILLMAQGYPPEHRRYGYREGHVRVNTLIDSIVVYKEKRDMYVFSGGKKIKHYKISLGYEPAGRKRFEGDLKTPEGLYNINDRSRVSSYHANLGISYPNFLDSIYARIYGLSPGGEIKIHGYPNVHRKDQELNFQNTDWTIGCIAVTDDEIDELYKWVKANCPILIFP